MDNPFLCGSKTLGQHWRALRDQLTLEKSDMEQLQLVAKFWAYAPISSPFLDWDHPAMWPDPWELIADMTFDASSKALGMQYTLLLGKDQRWLPDRLELDLVCLADKSNQFMMLTVDSHHVLNYEHARVVSAETVSKELVIQQRYQYINKTHCLRA